MSVWSVQVPPDGTLLSAEGVLVSVSISVAPSRLEALLDALAHLEFPVNPQLYHDACPDTLVEFPAYEARLSEIRGLLESYGFSAGSMTATGMLNSIRGRHAAAVA